MKSFLVCFMIILFTTSFAGCKFLNLAKKQYNLEDKCKSQSEAWAKSYQQKYPSDKISYESHFNKTMNKCFILVKYEQSELKSLKNINENKVYGSFLSKKNSKTVICNVLEKKCKTEQEWNSLIRPYMEE